MERAEFERKSPVQYVHIAREHWTKLAGLRINSKVYRTPRHRMVERDRARNAENRSHASPSGRSPKPLPKKIPGWSKSGALALIPWAPECPMPHPNRADTKGSWRLLR